MKSVLDIVDYFFNKDPRIASQRALAKEYRWKFLRRRKFEEDVISLNGFRLFDGKSKKRLKAMISFKHKQLKGGFRVFDFLHFDFGKRGTTIFEYTNPDLVLHSFMIEPRGGILKNMFGKSVQPIILTTTPEFDESYQINTDQPELFKETINVDFLDHIGDHKGWTYEAMDHSIIMYRLGSIVESVDMEREIDRFIKLCDDLVHGKNLM